MMHLVHADRAIGKSKGPKSTMAGIPSGTEPGTMKARIETARKVGMPLGKRIWVVPWP
jgi:hypothetical protein